MEFRKLFKKDTHYVVTEHMIKEFYFKKEAMRRNILLNTFDANKKSLVITNASGHGFGHILLQQKEDGSLSSKPKHWTMTGWCRRTLAGF